MKNHRKIILKLQTQEKSAWLIKFSNDSSHLGSAPDQKSSWDTFLTKIQRIYSSMTPTFLKMRTDWSIFGVKTRSQKQQTKTNFGTPIQETDESWLFFFRWEVPRIHNEKLGLFWDYSGHGQQAENKSWFLFLHLDVMATLKLNHWPIFVQSVSDCLSLFWNPGNWHKKSNFQNLRTEKKVR